MIELVGQLSNVCKLLPSTLNKLDQKEQERVTSKCERKVVRKFALETQKSMHSLYPTDRANKCEYEDMETLGKFRQVGSPMLQHLVVLGFGVQNVIMLGEVKMSCYHKHTRSKVVGGSLP